MKRKRIVILFVALVLGVLALSILLGSVRSGLVSAENDKPKGKLTRVFRREKQNKNDPLPDWVDQACKKGQFNGNYTAAEMVKAFIESTEYRQRFGQG